MRVKVNLRGETIEFTSPVGARLLDYLQENGVPVNAACGGNGVCHKCRVQMTQGFSAVTAQDRQAFRDSEIANGWRLSCQSRPKINLEVSVPSAENFRHRPRVVKRSDFSLQEAKPRSVSLVCDLGSTGVVVAITDHTGDSDNTADKAPIIEAHLLNRQVRFGADVMTRLHHAQLKGVHALQSALFDTLKLCLDAIREQAPNLFEAAFAGGLYCAGNSAMTSFLLNRSIDTLAVAPFQPASREAGEYSAPALGGIVLHTLPLLAGFVGGDTVAGILALEAIQAAQPWMLVDIGTNTEIVVNNGQDELWLSSAPAGPAFEGGNISQGMRAESGAISAARLENGEWKIETIHHDIPRGICGSGLIDILYEAVKGKAIAADGYLPQGRLCVTPEIGLLADDVREFQLAKSATRTAADLLIERAGATPKTIYLAGTFAQNLRLDSVAGVGLLTAGIPIKIIGNASLRGVALYAAMEPHKRAAFSERLERMRRPVELALQDDFQERFVHNLNFNSATT